MKQKRRTISARGCIENRLRHELLAEGLHRRAIQEWFGSGGVYTYHDCPPFLEA
jgi:hypothetical protein